MSTAPDTWIVSSHWRDEKTGRTGPSGMPQIYRGFYDSKDAALAAAASEVGKFARDGDALSWEHRAHHIARADARFLRWFGNELEMVGTATSVMVYGADFELFTIETLSERKARRLVDEWRQDGEAVSPETLQMFGYGQS